MAGSASSARVQRSIWAAAMAVAFVATVLAKSTPAAELVPGITMSVDASSVYAGDSVMIEIEAVGLIGELDISSLSRDADLLNDTGGTRIGVVDDRVVEILTRRLEYLPRQQGPARFGPLTGDSSRGPVRSNSVRVMVLPPADTRWQPSTTDLQTSFSLSSTTPVIGEAVVATLALRHRYPIADEQIVLADFDGFDVLPVQERRRTVVTEDDVAWREIAWRWLLFPTRSGPLEIAGARWAGEMIRSRTQRGRFVEALPGKQLDVTPATEPGWWLPASAVDLQETWSKDPREIKAGDELMRVITLTARDVLANQLPVVEPLESRAISSVLIDQTRAQRLIDGRVTSTATFTFRMQAQRPVPVFLDTVRVPWWNVGTRATAESIIPARRINVGLPERADLLSQLALEGRGLDRFWLVLASLGKRDTFWWVALVMLSAALGAIGLLEWRERRQARRSGGQCESALPPL